MISNTVGAGSCLTRLASLSRMLVLVLFFVGVISQAMLDLLLVGLFRLLKYDDKYIQRR
jgi:hypothetical protein